MWMMMVIGNGDDGDDGDDGDGSDGDNDGSEKERWG